MKNIVTFLIGTAAGLTVTFLVGVNLPLHYYLWGTQNPNDVPELIVPHSEESVVNLEVIKSVDGLQMYFNRGSVTTETLRKRIDRHGALHTDQKIILELPQNISVRQVYSILSDLDFLPRERLSVVYRIEKHRPEFYYSEKPKQNKAVVTTP